MNRKCFSTALVLVLAAGSAQADFSYEQTSKITGGMMAGMMKFAGAFSKQAREPMRSTVTIKGDRMTTTSANRLKHHRSGRRDDDRCRSGKEDIRGHHVR